MADENIDIRIRLRESAKFNAQTRQSANEVDNLGDQAAQAARKFRQLSRASSGTRVNLGLVSTRLRGGVLLFGAAALAVEKYTGTIISLGEAATSVAGGGVGAGAVGLSALAQGAITAQFALAGMGDALGGNTEAIKALQPEAVVLYETLFDAQERLRMAASTSFLPGLTEGGAAAMRNLPVILRNTEKTGRAMGRIAAKGGSMLGSAEWGRDLATMGNTNVTVIERMGDGALHLADAFRHILVEAGPLAKWLARTAEGGAATAEEFFEAKRESGEMAEFFRNARRDIRLLGQAGGAGGRGLINLFGASDVNGTETLRNFREIMERFERWSKSPTVQEGGVGKALVGEVEDVADDLVVALAEGMARSAPMAAEVFWNAFWKSSAEGKVLLGAAFLWKSGAFKLLGRRFGGVAGGGGGGGGLLGGGRGSMRNPMYVIVMNDVPGGGGGGGRGGGPWWKKGGVRGLLGRAGILGGAAWGANELAQRTAENDYPTRGPLNDRREETGRPSRGQQQLSLRRRVGPETYGPGAGRAEDMLRGRGSAMKRPFTVRSTVADIRMDGRKVGNAQLRHVIEEDRRRGRGNRR